MRVYIVYAILTQQNTMKTAC